MGIELLLLRTTAVREGQHTCNRHTLITKKRNKHACTPTWVVQADGSMMITIRKQHNDYISAHCCMSVSLMVCSSMSRATR